jgi:hypothetical protein
MDIFVHRPVFYSKTAIAAPSFASPGLLVRKAL